MNEKQPPKHELAVQVVVAVAAGVAGLRGPGATAVATSVSPLAVAGLSRITETIQSRRLEHATETLIDAADEFGVQTIEQFVEFIEAAVSDEEHQELLARALTIAQDTAMRDKRRALGRVLASAASDTGTRVDEELLAIRILADLDEPHIRLLRLMSTTPPPDLADLLGDGNVDRWIPYMIGTVDSGLASTVLPLLRVLERHHLVCQIDEDIRAVGIEDQYTITGNGEVFLQRLAEPAAGDLR